MKTALAIFLMICLQVAISPLCLCYGVEVTEETALRTCCHVPEDSEPAPCPHCDQEQPIAATAPVKGDFKAEAPEGSWSLLFGSNQESVELPSLRAAVEPFSTVIPVPSLVESRSLFQVFLI